MHVTMAVEGAEDLARALRALPEGLTRKVVIAALKEAGAPIAQTMSAMAPRQAESARARALAHTGYQRLEHMADSVRIQPLTPSRVTRAGRDPDTDFAVEIGPTKAHFYAFFQEHGTVHHGAHAFARPAFDAGSMPALGLVGKRLWEAIRKRVPAGGGQP